VLLHATGLLARGAELRRVGLTTMVDDGELLEVLDVMVGDEVGVPLEEHLHVTTSCFS
jgi:hypothetical protein